MFTDIHCHIINGIDDGAETAEMSCDMLDIASQEGIGNIIATPHFIYGDINNSAQIIREAGQETQRNALDRDIQLHFGSELFICPELCSLVEEGTASTLNDTRYVLVELPMLSIPDYTTDVLFELQLSGYLPIIAHPERNKVIQENPERLFKLVERGILSQVNATSINKIYGKTVQKTAFNLIERGLVHFVAADAHTCRGRAPKLKKAYDAIVERFDRDIGDSLFIVNGKSVINDREIETHALPQKKRFIFSFF